MIDWLRYAIIVVAVILAIVAYVDFRAALPPRRPAIALLILGGLLVLAQAVVAGVQMSRGHQMTETATFIGYTATNVLLLPAAAYVARVERSRWSTIALLIAALTVAVLQVRMYQLWTR